MAVLPGVVGALAAGSDPNAGIVTTLLPPLMSTPRIGGFPAGRFPAPPGPLPGEIPPRASGSDPRPVPDFAAQPPLPVIVLPGPFPWPVPVPPPAPPRPE